MSRPALDRMLDDLRAGTIDGIAVAAVDRLSRANVGEALAVIKEANEIAPGQLAILDLGVDPATEFGEFGLTILLALARMQWRRYKRVWESAQQRAVDRGVWIGPPPFGYRPTVIGHDRNGKPISGPLEEDPATGPIVREAFKVAAGEGLHAAMRYLKEAAPALRPLLVAGVLAAFAAIPTAASADPWCEPNESELTACTVLAGVTYTGAFVTQNDDDYFVMYVPYHENVFITATPGGGTGVEAEMDITGPGDSSVDRQWIQSGSVTQSADTLDQGIYTIHVTDDTYGNLPLPLPYSLQVLTNGTLYTADQYNALLNKQINEQAAIQARDYDAGQMSTYQGQVNYWQGQVNYYIGSVAYWTRLVDASNAAVKKDNAKLRKTHGTKARAKAQATLKRDKKTLASRQGSLRTAKSNVGNAQSHLGTAQSNLTYWQNRYNADQATVIANQ